MCYIVICLLQIWIRVFLCWVTMFPNGFPGAPKMGSWSRHDQAQAKISLSGTWLATFGHGHWDDVSTTGPVPFRSALGSSWQNRISHKWSDVQRSTLQGFGPCQNQGMARKCRKHASFWFRYEKGSVWLGICGANIEWLYKLAVRHHLRHDAALGKSEYMQHFDTFWL